MLGGLRRHAADLRAMGQTQRSLESLEIAPESETIRREREALGVSDRRLDR